MKITRPEDAEEIGTVCSNFDGIVDDLIAEKLKTGNFIAEYPAYGFYGTVWWDGVQFQCEVWRFNSHVETVSADEMVDIRDMCSEKYGCE